MARVLLLATLLLFAALPGVDAAEPSYCERTPDPRCDPGYCTQKPTDPYCADPDYCLHAPDDPICEGAQTPVPCTWAVEKPLALPLGDGAPGVALVTLDCPAHAKLAWECGSRDATSLAPRDPTPGTVACALVQEERTGSDTPCAMRWTWLAARAEARLATSWLSARVAPDLNCDGRADDGLAPGTTTVEWR